MASAATAGRLYASTASAAAAACVASAAYAAATRTAPASFTSSTVSAAAASFPSLGAVRAHKDRLPLAAEVGGNPKAVESGRFVWSSLFSSPNFFRLGDPRAVRYLVITPTVTRRLRTVAARTVAARVGTVSPNTTRFCIDEGAGAAASARGGAHTADGEQCGWLRGRMQAV